MAIYDEDFRELIEPAEEGLRDLFSASEPDSWLALRTAFHSLRDARLRDDREREKAAHKPTAEDDAATRQQRDAAWDEHYSREATWRAMPREAQENLLLDVLGDESLIASEIAARMDRHLNERQSWEPLVLRDGGSELETVKTEDARKVALRLLATGQLERTVREKGKKMLQHFSRRRSLAGPIADLERAYRDDNKGVS